MKSLMILAFACLGACATPKEWENVCRAKCAPEGVRYIGGVFGPVCRCDSDPKVRIIIRSGM